MSHQNLPNTQGRRNFKNLGGGQAYMVGVICNSWLEKVNVWPLQKIGGGSSFNILKRSGGPNT